MIWVVWHFYKHFEETPKQKPPLGLAFLTLVKYKRLILSKRNVAEIAFVKENLT